MVQQESEKLSRRERRRARQQAHGEGEAAEGTGAGGQAGEGEAAGESELSEEGPPEKAADRAANRKARRSAAAQARAARRREQAEARAVGLDASEMVDDALVRFADRAGKFVRKNSSTLQLIVVTFALGWMGVETYRWYAAKANAEASDVLLAATHAENGIIGDPEETGKPNAAGIVDPTPIFESDEQRLKAALAKYEEAERMREGRGPEAFALLGKAGVLLEMGKATESIAEYQAALALPLSDQQPLLRAAALRGLGLAHEAAGDLAEASRALAQLAEVEGFEQEGLYELARIQYRQEDLEAAQKSLSSLFERMGPPPSSRLGSPAAPPSFLRERAEQLASLVDPSGEKVKVPKAPSAALERMLRQVQQGGLSMPEQP